MNVLKVHHCDDDGLLTTALEHSWDEVNERCETWTDFMLDVGFEMPSDTQVDRIVDKIQVWQRLRASFWKRDYATVKAAPLSEKVLWGLTLKENLSIGIFMWNVFITKSVEVEARTTKRDGEYPQGFVWESVSRKVVGFRGTQGDGSDYTGVADEAPQTWRLLPLTLNSWTEEHAPFLRDTFDGQWFDVAAHVHGKTLAVDKYGTECHEYDAHEPTDNIYQRVYGDADLRNLLACFDLR